MDRLPLLRQMVAKTPADPFPRYGLAMELKKQGRLDEARTEFGTLVREHPGYVATYLMFGTLLVEMGARDEADEVLSRGIEAAGAAGNAHALGELEGALASLRGGG